LISLIEISTSITEVPVLDIVIKTIIPKNRYSKSEKLKLMLKLRIKTAMSLKSIFELYVKPK